MRIGTWNLEGKWSPDHLALLGEQSCDVWLLTEVHVDTVIPGVRVHRTADLMGATKSWAAVAAIDAVELAVKPDPHRASAMAQVDGRRFISSVLPWRSSGQAWEGATLAAKQQATLDVLRRHIDEATVWGGDWNQAFEGRDYVGTRDGRTQITAILDRVRLSVPTRSLGSAVAGHRSIDHVAVPMAWDVNSIHRVSAEVDGRRLSDHDAYVVSVLPD